MKFPPIYTVSEKISSTLQELTVLKTAFEIIPVPKETMIHLRRQSLLKSSLFSARIEGNPLLLEDIEFERTGRDDIHKKEIANIERAITFFPPVPSDINKEFIKSLHAIVMDGLSGMAGHFRTEESAIFNQAGIAVYLNPPPQKIISHIQELCHWVSYARDSVPVKSAVGHIWFEKIHPFDDGNGRVGRLLSERILQKEGYDFGGIVPFEEYLDDNRQEYYEALAKDTQDVTQFVEFFLNALLTQARKSLKELKNPPMIRYPNLSPRRGEICSIIREHAMVSFDFLHRRFRLVPSATLHYDLQFLVKKGYIVKLGSTRGVLYTVKR